MEAATQANKSGAEWHADNEAHLNSLTEVQRAGIFYRKIYALHRALEYTRHALTEEYEDNPTTAALHHKGLDRLSLALGATLNHGAFDFQKFPPCQNQVVSAIVCSIEKAAFELSHEESDPSAIMEHRHQATGHVVSALKKTDQLLHDLVRHYPDIDNSIDKQDFLREASYVNHHDDDSVVDQLSREFYDQGRKVQNIAGGWSRAEGVLKVTPVEKASEVTALAYGFYAIMVGAPAAFVRPISAGRQRRNLGEDITRVKESIPPGKERLSIATNEASFIGRDMFNLAVDCTHAEMGNGVYYDIEKRQESLGRHAAQVTQARAEEAHTRQL